MLGTVHRRPHTGSGLTVRVTAGFDFDWSVTHKRRQHLDTPNRDV
ncbi:hypothetical protein BTZ20_4292 [Rhodococcus sp. MTM3W5.2]|nr:hypothetical protein BTZ20_4292 [Rhodococcus sp. MTM3W5.2]